MLLAAVVVAPFARPRVVFMVNRLMRGACITKSCGRGSWLGDGMVIGGLGKDGGAGLRSQKCRGG